MFRPLNTGFLFVVFACTLLGRCIATPANQVQDKSIADRLTASENQRPDLHVGQSDDQEWCDPTLGCLEITDDWYTPGRPINVLPDSREDINTRFYLHTRLQPNADTDYAVSADDLTSLAESTFDVSKPTKFIVHGFIDTGDTSWLKELAAALLVYGDYNVFRVDWGDGSKPLYDQATANTRVAGLEIGYLVNTLIAAYGLDQANVHCIGHSLGSHVCGYAGEQVVDFGRITGMDPAGPYYTGTPDFVHLDPTDAVFVDAIHTDADSIFLLGYGTAEPMGNVDFYPNSGHDQPGCDPVDIAIDEITDSDGSIVACSHHRAIAYFMESLDSSTCAWLAHECYDYDSFEEGSCFSCGEDNTKCAYLGIRADEYVAKTRKFASFYLDTNKKNPYCMEHYEVSILTAYPTEAESWVMGRLQIWLYGDTGEVIEDVQITKDHERIDHGQIDTNIFISHEYVGNIIRVELKWVYDDNVFNPGTYCWNLVCNRSLYVQTIEVSPINHYPESDRLVYTVQACSRDGSMTEIESGDTESFLTSSNCESLEGH